MENAGLALPDNFAGTANASWHLFVANRFADALPYAQAADVPQDPLRAIATDRVGRILLAQERPKRRCSVFPFPVMPIVPARCGARRTRWRC